MLSKTVFSVIAVVFSFASVYGEGSGGIFPETSVSSIFRSSKKNPVKRVAPGKSVSLKFKLKKPSCPVKRSLLFTGSLDGSGKGEGGFRGLDFFLSDAAQLLDSKSSEYGLKIVGWGKPFRQSAYCLFHGNSFGNGGKVTIEVIASVDNLKFGDGGKAGITLDLYLKNRNFKNGDIRREPEKTIFIPFPEGSYSGKRISKEVEIPGNIDSLLLSVGGYNFNGTIAVKPIHLTKNGKAIPVPPIKPDSKLWIGSNISRRVWPEFSFSIDNKIFFTGPVFQRAANTLTDFEINLPDIDPGDHTLSLSLLKSWGDDKAYNLSSITLFQEKARDFEVIGCPDFIPEHSEFSVMIETNKDNLEFQISGTKGVVPMTKTIKFEKKGVHAVPFTSLNAGSSPTILLKGDTRTEKIPIRMITSGKSDNVLLSTSDWIYTGRHHFNSYFKWLYANDICNSLVIRPSYQWNGTRTRDEAFFRKLVVLCDNFYMPYSLMMEGRCLPGAQINPEDRWLAGKYYLGRQAHEDDGCYYYWGPWGPYPNDLDRKLMGRFLDGGGIFPKFNYSNGAVHNMKEGAEYFISNIKKAKHDSTRHTGPSVLFRYFYQAGYNWLGAEQGYGPDEVTVSAIRGASRAYGKKRFGSHHATQWGGGYVVEAQFLAHAIAYIHGVTHINTEDALWDTESLNHRFSVQGLLHVKRQKDIMEFILAHRRRGEMKVDIAVLQGKYDGWTSFGPMPSSMPIWGQAGDEWKAGDAESSFELLKVFYPRKHWMWFSAGGTPYGSIDLLPVEAPLDVMNKYDALIFLGWNTYDENYFARLKLFVENGGVLLMTLAHLNTNLIHNAPITLPEKSAFYKLIMKGLKKGKEFTSQSISLGKGKVIIFNTDKYPGNSKLRAAYAAEMRKLGDGLIAKERGKGWIKGSETVEFTVWDYVKCGKDYRTLYILNTKSDKTQSVKFFFDKSEFDLDVKPGVIKTFFISSGVAVTSSDPLTDILKIERDDQAGAVITAQVPAPCTLNVYDALSGKISKLKIDKTGILTKHIKLK